MQAETDNIAKERLKSEISPAVLMDIRMPVMDGIEATRRIRTMERPDSRTIPIIAMTANAFDQDSRKSLDSGMNGHLSKPIRVEELLGMLDACL